MLPVLLNESHCYCVFVSVLVLSINLSLFHLGFPVENSWVNKSQCVHVCYKMLCCLMSQVFVRNSYSIFLVLLFLINSINYRSIWRDLPPSSSAQHHWQSDVSGPGRLGAFAVWAAWQAAWFCRTRRQSTSSSDATSTLQIGSWLATLHHPECKLQTCGYSCVTESDRASLGVCTIEWHMLHPKNGCSGWSDHGHNSAVYGILCMWSCYFSIYSHFLYIFTLSRCNQMFVSFHDCKFAWGVFLGWIYDIEVMTVPLLSSCCCSLQHVLDFRYIGFSECNNCCDPVCVVLLLPKTSITSSSPE